MNVPFWSLSWKRPNGRRESSLVTTEKPQQLGDGCLGSLGGAWRQFDYVEGVLAL